MSGKCHVFLSPHTDDETIAMAGAITDAKESGARVCVVLVTDNRPSANMISQLDPLTENELVNIRLLEFARACEALRVDQVDYFGLKETDIVDAPEKAIDAILWVMELAFRNEPDTVLHVTAGRGDPHNRTGRSNLSHIVCYKAAQAFKAKHPDAEVHAHYVYCYSFHPSTRTAPMIRNLSALEMQRKRAALDCYKRGIGYGYRSVRDLFDAAASDPREFYEVLT